MTDETHVHEEDAQAAQGDEEILAALTAERDAAIDNWKRTAADFDNFRKRALRVGRSTSRLRTSGS